MYYTIAEAVTQYNAAHEAAIDSVDVAQWLEQSGDALIDNPDVAASAIEDRYLINSDKIGEMIRLFVYWCTHNRPSGQEAEITPVPLDVNVDVSARLVYTPQTEGGVVPGLVDELSGEINWLVRQASQELDQQIVEYVDDYLESKRLRRMVNNRIVKTISSHQG